MGWRAWLNLLLEHPEESRLGWRLQEAIMLVLFVNIVGMATETMDGPRFGSSEPAYDYLPGQSTYNTAQLLFTLFYALEFTARWVTTPSQRAFWQSVVTWIRVLALIASFPKIVALAMGASTSLAETFMNYLRLFRIVRLIVLARMYVGTKVLLHAALQAIAPLKITLFFLITVVMVFATAIFYAEPCYDLQTCTFTDIFNAGYFVMVTVATVGYGGQVPSLHNVGALLITCIVIIFGTLYLAMPYAIVGVKYELAWRDHDERMLRAQRTHENLPTAEVTTDIASQVSRRRVSGASLGSVHHLNLNRNDQTLVQLEAETTNAASSGACDRFYELSQHLLSVQHSVQQFIALDVDPSHPSVTMETVLQHHKRRNEGTSRTLDAITAVLKLHRRVCADVHALLPPPNHAESSTAEAEDEAEVKDGSVNPERFTSSRHFQPAASSHDKLGHPRRTMNSGTYASTTLSHAKKMLTAMGLSAVKAHTVRVQHADPHSRRAIIWSCLEHQQDIWWSRVLNRVRLYIVLLSIALFYLQTTPELQETGLRSVLCQRSIRDFCYYHDEPGCYIFQQVADSGSESDGNASVSVSVTSEHVRFDCAIGASDPSCYASGVNFGSENFPLPCNETFGVDGISRICNNRLCISSLRMVFDMEPYWVYFEFFFGVVFTTKLILRMYAHPARRHLWSDFDVIVDVLVLFPFYVEVGMIIAGGTPTYSIVPTTPSFFTAIRILKTLRIIKLSTHIPGSRVLAKTAELIWRRLMIPLFFLFVGSVLSAAVFYELERGTECFVGMRCMWWGIDVLTPEMSEGLPLGKRILVQNTNPTIITDMLRSTWFSLVTFTTVGYGDLYPRTILGKLFDIVGTIFSACYTAMPLTLVGDQFYICYDIYASKEMRLHRGTETPVESRDGNSSARVTAKPERLGSIPTPSPTIHEEGVSTSDAAATSGYSNSSVSRSTSDSLDPHKAPARLHRASTMPMNGREKVMSDHYASTPKMQPVLASVELDILNQFALVHKVLNEMIADLSKLNRLGTERVAVARRGTVAIGSTILVRPTATATQDGAALLGGVKSREEALETKIAKNMVFCMTVLLNFAPVVERMLETPQTTRKPALDVPPTPVVEPGIREEINATRKKVEAMGGSSRRVACDDVQASESSESSEPNAPTSFGRRVLSRGWAWQRSGLS